MTRSRTVTMRAALDTRHSLSLDHLPMRPGCWNIKHFRVHHPAVFLIERKGWHTRVAPEKSHVRDLQNGGLRAHQQLATEAAALMRIVRAHSTQLPGRFFLVRIEHETRARNGRRVFIRRRGIKNSHVPG